MMNQHWPSPSPSTQLPHRSRTPFAASNISRTPFSSFSPSFSPSAAGLIHNANTNRTPSTFAPHPSYHNLDTASSPSDKRNSGGSSASGSAGRLDTSVWRSNNNVYIKGLPERCSNEDLQTWAEQVAKPISVKTIRDARDHGICTGLGFVRFALPAQAKLFIALVNAVEGYEACFARETYVGKMDKAADPRSANLYLSHIPLTYTEQDVLALFPSPTYTVRSLRLLHEGDQPGQRAPAGTPFKGAGFIRLDTREMADRAISELNGKRLPGHGRRPGRSSLANGELHSYYDTLQVRFADTEVQKQIKTSESEMEKIHALEMSGQMPPRSRKGQAYRRLSFSTEQKLRNNGRKGRRGSGASVGVGIDMGGSAMPPLLSSYGSLGLPISLPLGPQGHLPLPSSFGSNTFGFSPSHVKSRRPSLNRTTSYPMAPPNSPNNTFTSNHYASDTPPSLGGFTSSSAYSSSPGSFASNSPVSHYGYLPPRHAPDAFQSAVRSNVGLGLSFGSGMLDNNANNSSNVNGFQPHSNKVSQGMLALQAQQDEVNRSFQNIDRMTGRRPSEAFLNTSFEHFTSRFGNTILGEDDDEMNEARATYDLSKLGFAPPSTPPPEGSHAFFDASVRDSSYNNNYNQRPSSRNHQRAHTTAALYAFPATPTSIDPDYSPHKLLAPASALARRSTAVEARIARRRGSQVSLNSSFGNQLF